MTASMQGFQVRVGVAAALLALGLAGCGGASDEGGATVRAKAKTEAPGPAAKSPTGDDDPKYASAVVSGKTSAPVDLKYDLSAKPKAGEPFEIELVFKPRLPADTLEVELSGMPGLTLVQQGTFRFDKVQAEVPCTQKITIQADADGTYYVSIVARMITQVQTEVRTFSVPIVVGTAPALAKPTPQKDASGQPIEPMPAKEPKAQ